MTAVTAISGCREKNPLLGDYGTPFDTPPFDRINPGHYEPAFAEAIKRKRAEVDAIAGSTEAPTFENTVVALELSGELLNDVAGVFFNINGAETNDTIQEIARRVQPLLTELENDISLNEALFGRIKTVYENRDTLALTSEQRMLLERTYKGFIRNGAGLDEAAKARYREITDQLGRLTLAFGQNLLEETNGFTYNIIDSALVADLPQFVRDAMAAEAKERGEKGWTVTLQGPSINPFLMYSGNRQLKEILWRKYNSRGFAGGDHDNSQTVKQIAGLRLEMAKLLGYNAYADYVLEERMAGNADNVNALLGELLEKCRPYAEREYRAVGEYARKQTGDPKFVMMPWDFGYFNEKYRNETFALSQEEIKPYLKLENVQQAVFMLAGKLYGITFKENAAIPVYHPDVKAYEVYDADGKYLAILYMDFFPRKGKRPGAWMNTFREMYVDRDGKEVRPLVTVCCNFTKPTAGEPSLLTFDELTTILHEFGHALHGIFAQGLYPSLTGTGVYRDFVELPSQIMENWATEKEFLDLWAVHYQTGERMPQELIDKITASKNYLASYLTLRQLSFGFNDMAWHSITSPVEVTVDQFERKAIAATQLFPPVDGTCISTAFGHIFSGGYAAGYYSYKWAEVLEADAYSLFEEKGIFNRDVAGSFRGNILSKGGSESPMELYVRFRGHKPEVEALLAKIGVK